MPKCGHASSNFYVSSQDYNRCRICDRIANRKAYGNPDSSIEIKKPGPKSRYKGDETEKNCSICKLLLSLDDFHKLKTGPLGRESFCKKCRKEKYATPDRNRDFALRRLYGITLEMYNIMSELQDHKCWICGKHESECRLQVLDIDHCHSSKEVRGLLCNDCNGGVARFKDSIELLGEAIMYLQKTSLSKSVLP